MRSVGNTSSSAPGKKVVETEIIVSLSGVPRTDIWDDEDMEALRDHDK